MSLANMELFNFFATNQLFCKKADQLRFSELVAIHTLLQFALFSSKSKIRSKKGAADTARKFTDREQSSNLAVTDLEADEIKTKAQIAPANKRLAYYSELDACN